MPIVVGIREVKAPISSKVRGYRLVAVHKNREQRTFSGTMKQSWAPRYRIREEGDFIKRVDAERALTQFIEGLKRAPLSVHGVEIVLD